MTMLFEMDIEPVGVMVICLGGCAVIGHLALYARQGNLMVTICLSIVIIAILVFWLHVAGWRIIPCPQPKYAWGSAAVAVAKDGRKRAIEKWRRK
jgi:hypothetical protein